MARTHRLQLREWRAKEETPPPARQVDAPNAIEEDTLANRPDLTRELERILSEGGMLSPRESSSWWKRVRNLVHDRLDGRHRSGS
jgi:hypothetical protein